MSNTEALRTRLLEHAAIHDAETSPYSPEQAQWAADLREAAAALAQQPAAMCACKDRPAADCPGEWESGCDLGANAAHVVVAQPAASDAPDDAHPLYQRGWKAGYKHGAWQSRHTQPAATDAERADSATVVVERGAGVVSDNAAPVAPAEPASEPVAWMTHHDEPMLFPTQAEAAQYCEDDERPIALYSAPQPAPALVPLTNKQRTAGASAWAAAWADPDLSPADKAAAVYMAMLTAADITAKEAL